MSLSGAAFSFTVNGMTPEARESSSLQRLTPDQTRCAIDPELDAPWSELAASSLGRLSLNEVRDLVTKAMLTLALERSDHNYSRAAAQLGVTRQAVQYLVHRHAPPLRPDRVRRRSARLGAGSA